MRPAVVLGQGLTEAGGPVLTPNDFPGTGTLSHALLAFVHRCNLTVRPFKLEVHRR